ncbi:hypothetical protein GCM10010840_30060 [Deinococcus aerolatus]|uniref:Uncharacterized protein n=1 Tax=Deinococcus aerolatus TaxID=522487 RepID=A0ABQ2GEQ9_9DEIO|nr:hypothetical protein GCM10010840_30060 [Deinococcus aerolatus]
MFTSADFSGCFGFDGKSLFAPDAPNALFVDDDPPPCEQGVDETVAPAGKPARQIMDLLSEFAVLAWLWAVMPGRFGQAHQNTSPKGLDVRRDQLPDHGAFLGGH